ncbi:hypothetical protein MVES1_000254 [Malassezia vespertilionis]|uniref:Uncharacterized protein n=1 Tax=Malassezia vespertilionis TaxID=2020962 RepID=A0A2N1JGL2_9BASI|nr:uncharacterized protein MVES1_000254 [Malassezia vespertilionis]PKI85691.1 hypothetical protein MVES_000240 [Malassezia vespertilionis]WFD04929.1 hypothetical protein MVES1_000254 [Malassezia vespertilionis]
MHRAGRARLGVRDVRWYAAVAPARACTIAAESRSVRALMDACVGRGQWRVRQSVAHRLADLPLLDGAEAVRRMETALGARGVRQAQFLDWYNAMTRPTFAEAVPLLEKYAALPPFVLQRALTRVSSVAETTDAVRIAARHCAAYSVDNATRMYSNLLDTCLREQHAWHVAAPLTSLVLDAAHAWLNKKWHARPQEAQQLIQKMAAILLAGADDRARKAFVRVLSMARAHLPETAVWIEAQVLHPRHVRRRGERRATSSLLNVAVMQALLHDASPQHAQALIALGVRVAATHRDPAQAKAWFGALAHTAGAPTTAFLRALAHSHDGADIQRAWALFDTYAAAGAHHAAPLADWMLMLRAAAGDARISAAHALALVQLRTDDTPFEQMQAMAAQWHAPPDVQDRLCSSLVAHTAVLDGFLARNNVPMAYAVWDAMLRRNIAPDTVALVSLCKLHFRAGSPREALEAIVQWCQHGQQLPTKETGALVLDKAPQAAHGRRRRVTPSTYLANTILQGLLQHGAYRTLFHVWQTLVPVLHVRPDVASLDLLLAAAIAAGADQEQPYAYMARAMFRRALFIQHPALQTMSSMLDSPTQNWLLRGEQQLRRWERWLEDRFAHFFTRQQGMLETVEPVHVSFDARVMHRYSMLLLAMLQGRGASSDLPLAVVRDELFRIPRWMQALDLAPQRETQCLWFSAQDAMLPPGVAMRREKTPLYTGLAAWLGEEALPSAEEIGAWYRGCEGG